MSIVKEANLRKKEILDAAAILFAEKGFDNTSVIDIMNAVGIAKGTLYHHFKSKEDIMDALIKRQTNYIISAAKKIAEDKSIPVEERITRTTLALRIENKAQTQGREIIEHLHKPQNALMHQKTKQIIFKHIPPIMADILKDGIKQGLFETPYPLECMEMALCYLDTILDDNALELTEEQLIIKIHAFIFNLEKLLCVDTGTLASYEQAFLKGGCE